MTSQIVLFLTAVSGFLVNAVLTLRLYLLARRILAILSEIAPETEARLAVHTGYSIIDNMLWMRPFRFQRFLSSREARRDPRLASSVDAYLKTRDLGLITFSVMVLAICVELVLFSYVGADTR